MNTATYNMFSVPQQQPVIIPFGPVVGRNSRERRRIRRAQDRMQKALEAAATTVLTPSSLYPSATPTPAVPTQHRGHHHHQSVDWSRPAQRPIHHARSRSTPSAVCGDIRSLWAIADNSSAANGFPTAFSIPRRSNPVGTNPQSRPSSIALLDCFDPEVDCLSDLDSLLWTAKATVEESIPDLCHSPASSTSGSSSLFSSPPELHLPLPAAMYHTNTAKNAETAYFRSF
ncbi:hypothetical protein M407DRAFT_28220 [Tulasnella calospora MUT 4182]|uniref:Uncharacterized protein n=1 Tax=Tulasnella calospora MUT 4182 TaxID=1051891 RepID=A0A0C3KLL3_9AGAM|nr:hypothetical protein M407DRAFT_28220 [Tulasnella calospora MUT 4182]